MGPVDAGPIAQAYFHVTVENTLSMISGNGRLYFTGSAVDFQTILKVIRPGVAIESNARPSWPIDLGDVPHIFHRRQFFHSTFRLTRMLRCGSVGISLHIRGGVESDFSLTPSFAGTRIRRIGVGSDPTEISALKQKRPPLRMAGGSGSRT